MVLEQFLKWAFDGWLWVDPFGVEVERVDRWEMESLERKEKEILGRFWSFERMVETLLMVDLWPF